MKKNKKSVNISKCMLLVLEVILFVIFVYATQNIFVYNNFYIINAILFFASSISLLILLTLINWKLFEKAGKKGWLSLIPFYNLFIRTKIAMGNGWISLLYLIPFVSIIFSVIVNYKLSKSFGKSNTFAVFGSVFCLLALTIIICDDAKYTLYNVEEKDTSKRDKIMFIVTIIFIIITFIPCLWAKELENNNFIIDNSNNNTTNNDILYLSADVNTINFSCSLSESGVYNSIYGAKDYVYCNMKVSNSYNYEISNMELEYNYSDNIDLNSIYSLSDNWNIKKNLGHIEITQLKNDSDISDIYFKFYIKNNKGVTDAYKIIIENIKFKSNNSNYKIRENKVIRLAIENERNIKIDNVIKFEKLSSDGSFQTINKYTCNNDLCEVNLASQIFAYNNEDSNIVMITDGNYNILFDKTKGIIDTYGDKPQWLYLEDGITGKYIYINKKDSNKYGIIDKNGNVIKEFNLNEWPYTVYMRLFSLRYSIENDMLVDIKNDKYGIIKLTSDDIIVDYIYEDLDLINSKIFKAKNDNSWYVYDIKTQQKYIEEGFDYIHYASDEILIVEKDNTLYLKNYNNKKIIDDTIKITKEDVIQAYVDYSNNNIISIHICKDEYCYDYKERYEYNIADNKLTKIN